MTNYNPKEIEPKWQKYWGKHPELFEAENDSKAEKAYILDMFPYPSGDGLHVGHVESYTATDIYSRYLRMNRKNVLHPQGFDAFGLPAENYAIKTGIHPAETTKKAIETFKKQISSMGFSYDWSREVISSDPEYYKWTQWFFLLLYKNGLAYRKKAKVNWCPKCQTVLANEQAETGKCERCETEVIQKDLEQWFFRITDFIEDSPRTLRGLERGSDADKEMTAGLLSGLDKVDWPESTKTAQKNWIGRSEGVQFKMQIEGTGESIEVYTTRIDTVFGMTYAVVAPEHEAIQKLKDKIENWKEVEKYLEEAKKKTDLDRMEEKIKTGVELKGIKIINPLNNESLPLFVADYVLGHYGTGAVMAVPAHDERDWEFAKNYNLPIKEVIIPKDQEIIGSGAMLETPAGNFIFQKRDGNTDRNPNMIAPFGGGCNKDESFEECLKRELQEEIALNININNISVIGKIESHLFPGKFINIYHVKNVDSENLKVSEGDGLIELSLNEALQNEKVTEYTKNVIRYYQQRNNFAFTEDGNLVNSNTYDKLTSEDAREKIIKWLEKNKLGFRKINYKLRDWLVSRQRYWGAPIPIIYCDKCGEVPVPEKDLPVLLPDDVDFKPTGESPLKYSKKFQDVKCPKCGGKGRRESDTMDTFVCSSWYYLRYSDPKNKKEFASKEMLKKWLPVDLYIGGAEHIVLHLLYARFFTKALHKLGYLEFDEPFLKLRHQGIILAENGEKMSKSKGNVVNPDDVVKQYGADALRCFEMFMGPLEDMKPWQTKGIVGIYRFLEKVCKINSKLKNQNSKPQLKTQNLKIIINKTIQKVSEDIKNLKFNTAISALMILVNEMEKEKDISVTDYGLLITLLSPFAPHLAEEIWQGQLKHTESIFKEKWPEYDPKLIKDEEIELVIQINGKVRDKIQVSADISESEAKELAMSSEKLKNYLAGKEIKKVIFVKGRLMNIVI